MYTQSNSNARYSAPVLVLAALVALAPAATAGSVRASGPDTYTVSVVATDLNSPKGIVALGINGLAFTEVPTPGIAGPDGGMNSVKSLDLRNAEIRTLSEGEPEPVNLALDRWWTLYWTCKTAGVILEKPFWGDPALFIDGLNAPNGVAVDRYGDLLFTELPDPGNSGNNSVSVTDGTAVTVLSSVEPAPTDIAIGSNGVAYWTCRSAGVIVRRSAAGVITVLLQDLNAPTGIAVDAWGRNLYFTETPTPGVPGTEGGENRVIKVDLETLEQTVINEGDPEPTDVTVNRLGRVYWTCTSAGVIVCAKPRARGRH